MIKINDTELDSNLRWLNRWESSRRGFNHTIMIDGTGVNTSMPIADSRVFRLGTLEKNGYYGLWTEAQIEFIDQLEISGELFTLIYDGTTYTAVVIPGTKKFTQLTPSNTAGYGDAYVGSVDFQIS